MVHVAIAGGSGNVGGEVVRELVKQSKHQVTVLSRKDVPRLSDAGIHVVRVDYLDEEELVKALQGVHTVLSFLVSDPENIGQINLINASVAVGAKRFAPSEWGSFVNHLFYTEILSTDQFPTYRKSNSGFPGFDFKDRVYEYLKEINVEKSVLEYCLFQPGSFMNYLSYPYPSAEQLTVQCIGIDLETKQALITEDGEASQVFTTVDDFAKVVALAIDYDKKWPEVGGIVGERIKQKDYIKLVEKHAGGPFELHRLEIADLEKAELKSAWQPPFSHPSMSAQMIEALAPKVYAWRESAMTRGALDVSSDWNTLLPDLKMTNIDTFLSSVLREKS